MRKKLIIALMVTLMLGINGCGRQENLREAKVFIEDYTPKKYETIEMKKGNLQAEITLTLKAANYRRVNYHPVYDEMKVKKVNVEIGDHVKKGQVMITFESEELEKRIKSYRNSLDEHQLMLEHYTNLAALNKDKDEIPNFELDINQIKESIEVDKLYIDELTARLESYSIVAEDNGTVFDMAQGLDMTTVNMGNTLVTVVYGNETFITETEEEFDFNIGDTYTAEFNSSYYNIVLDDMENIALEGSSTPKWKLTFSAAEGTDFGYTEDMIITIKKPPMTDVNYLPKGCIHQLDEDKYYVYVMEDGFRTVRYVEIGDTVVDNTVILSGLDMDDRVVVE